jgi:hypothetical protein
MKSSIDEAEIDSSVVCLLPQQIRGKDTYLCLFPGDLTPFQLHKVDITSISALALLTIKMLADKIQLQMGHIAGLKFSTRLKSGLVIKRMHS